MTTEDKHILKICKYVNSRGGDEEEITSSLPSISSNLNYFHKMLLKHEIAPLVYNKLIKSSLCSSVEYKIKKLGLPLILQAKLQNQQYKKELVRIKKTMDKNKVEFILLKGLSLDSSELRVSGDIDILVHQNQFLMAMGSLIEIGYDYVGLSSNPHLNPSERRALASALAKQRLEENEKIYIENLLAWNNHYEMFNPKIGVVLEIHTNLFQSERVYVEDLSPVLKQIRYFWNTKRCNESVGCYVLSPEHSLIHLCLHNAINRSPANNTYILKLLLDIDKMIEHGILWDSFVDITVALKIAPFVLFSLLMTRELLDTVIPLFIVKRLEMNCTASQLWMTRIHLRCINSLQSNSILLSCVYSFVCAFVLEYRCAYSLLCLFFFHILFPARKKMSYIYYLDESSPLILFTYIINPIRWFYLVMRKILRK